LRAEYWLPEFGESSRSDLVNECNVTVDKGISFGILLQGWVIIDSNNIMYISKKLEYRILCFNYKEMVFEIDVYPDVNIAQCIYILKNHMPLHTYK
jgi:hypothetical protein